MEIYSSCKQSIETCLRTKTFSAAHLYCDEKPMDMHIHDCYEIYYSISGGKQFLIDNTLYTISPGDIFFINQYESHHLTKIDQQVHERIVLSICPEYLKALSTVQTNLDACFHHYSRKYNHKVSLNTEAQKTFLHYIQKLKQLDGYGSDLLEQAAFTELMVFLSSLFTADALEQNVKETRMHTQVDALLSYINQHIDEPLTLEQLSAHFYLSPSYLCRLFKASTGTTINKYITARRISRAKELLAEGYRISEACEKCGFHDYSNFFKAFTKATGLPPREYARTLKGTPSSSL